MRKRGPLKLSREFIVDHTSPEGRVPGRPEDYPIAKRCKEAAALIETGQEHKYIEPELLKKEA